MRYFPTTCDSLCLSRTSLSLSHVRCCFLCLMPQPLPSPPSTPCWTSVVSSSVQGWNKACRLIVIEGCLHGGRGEGWSTHTEQPGSFLFGRERQHGRLLHRGCRQSSRLRLLDVYGCHFFGLLLHCRHWRRGRKPALTDIFTIFFMFQPMYLDVSLCWIKLLQRDFLWCFNFVL